MIELQEINKTYTRGAGESVAAIVDLSMKIDRGEFVAIVGSSGSGKSTLMNIIGLLDAPTGGRYLLNGVDVATLGVNDQARWRNQRIGFVFQAFHLLPRASALENVELPLLYSDRPSTNGLGQRALEAVGLGERIRHRPSELSGGQQQRVAIARALVNNPELILADEPTGNLDRGSAAEIMAIFRELSRSGRTIVLVTHDQEIASQCGRIARIEQGRIVEDNSVPSRATLSQTVPTKAGYFSASTKEAQ